MPQLVVNGKLAPMRVEAAVLGVVDAGPEVGADYLGRVAKPLSERISPILHFRNIALRRRPEDVRSLERGLAGLPDELGHDVPSLGPAVHLRERVESVQPRLLVLNVGEQPVGFQVSHGRHRHPHARQRPGQPSAEVQARKHVLASWVQVSDGASEPTLPDHLRGFGGVPDVHGPEVGAVGFRVADAVYDGDIAVVPQPLDGAHLRAQPQPVVELQYLVLFVVDGGAVVVVELVVVRNDRVQAIVAAGELDDHQRPV